MRGPLIGRVRAGGGGPCFTRAQAETRSRAGKHTRTHAPPYDFNVPLWWLRLDGHLNDLRAMPILKHDVGR